MLVPLVVSVALAEPTHTVQTVLPTLGELGLVIKKIEEEGYQITDMSLGLIFEERAATVPVALEEDEGVILVGLGDRLRLADLDMSLFDERGGLMASDELPDAMPVIIFQAPREGVYDARVQIARTDPAYRGGFYAMVQGRPTDRRVVTVADTWAQMMDAVTLLEADGYQVLRSQWQTLALGEEGAMSFEVPTGAGACTAIAIGSAGRTRELRMTVLNPDRAQVGFDDAHGQRALVSFEAGGAGIWELQVAPDRLRRRATETHAVVTVACQVGVG